MKVIVKSKEDNTNLKLIIPMSVAIVALRIGKPFIKEEYIKKYCKIDNKAEIVKDNESVKLMIDSLIKGLNYLKKNHKGLVLVDIEDNGDIVKIIL